MKQQKYPCVEINLNHLKHNAQEINRRCEEVGIDLVGVIKGATGLPLVAKQYIDGGAKMIASSRLEQIEDCINSGLKTKYLCLRVPMLSEVSEVVRLADYSLNSELKVLKALNEAAKKQGKKHNVIIMADLGDLREGFWDKDEMIDVALLVENEMENLILSGVGTNLGCYGSIVPTPDKLEELIAIAEKIESKIGRELEYISGGATTSLMRLWDGDMPERINMLRVGEGVILGRDLDRYFDYDLSSLHQDVMTLKAEIIEVKDKPSHPIGEMGIDAFGHLPTYPDRGIRRRALLGLGKVDYADTSYLEPLEENIEILGASSDHTILDIEDNVNNLSVGDVLKFKVGYSVMVYVTNCRNVKMYYID
ncbi:MAG: alanine/ornithine racemase family PLP-dependent enzyme [Clostridiales bacterium]|nr:alanine/ornithine racemase family PLP-dependent enzyme [Clostridiales bacterium]